LEQTDAPLLKNRYPLKIAIRELKRKRKKKIPVFYMQIPVLNPEFSNLALCVFYMQIPVLNPELAYIRKEVACLKKKSFVCNY
jgi:hypothetical protein